MFVFMIAWHFIGQQNLSKEAYRIQPSAYEAKVDEFARKYQVREEAGRAGREAAKPGDDVYLLGRLWQWWPIVELEKGRATASICPRSIGSTASRCSPPTSTSGPSRD